MSYEPFEHTGLECPLCGEHIYSLYRHDFRSCGCGYCFVDGGVDYFRWGWGVYYSEDKKQTALVNETLGKPKTVQKTFYKRPITKPSIDDLFKEITGCKL